MSDPRIALAAPQTPSTCEVAHLAKRANADWYERSFVSHGGARTEHAGLDPACQPAEAIAIAPRPIALVERAAWRRALAGPVALAERNLALAVAELVHEVATCELDFAVLFLPGESNHVVQSNSITSIEDQRHLLRRALLIARFEAELAGVRLAITVGRDSPLCDPLVARDFLDDLATPWIGAYVEAPAADAVDWQRILAVRTLAVHTQRDAGVAAALGELGAKGAYLAIDGA